jgi:hypothetical protein
MVFKLTYNRNVANAGYTNETPIQVIKRALGPISILFRKYPDHIPVMHDSKELQNTTTMSNE